MKSLPKPVISVGNITWGGTGKTPVVIKLANAILRKGLKPAILTRGYKRKNNNCNCLILSDGKQILASKEASGDEPYMIAESVPEAIILVGANRFLCGSLALEKFKPDIFILDDGFQQWKLKRDLDVVCINAQNPFGNGCLIPSGILREPVSSIIRAGMIILTNTDLVDEEQLICIEREIEQYSKNIPVRIGNKIKSLRKLIDNEKKSITEFQNMKVIALSAIADNKRFKLTLEKNGINVYKHVAFRDHHWYSLNEINSIFLCADKNCPIITTSKDEVRLKKLMDVLNKQDAERIFVLDIEIEFIKGENIWEQNIEKTLQFS